MLHPAPPQYLPPGGGAPGTSPSTVKVYNGAAGTGLSGGDRSSQRDRRSHAGGFLSSGGFHKVKEAMHHDYGLGHHAHDADTHIVEGTYTTNSMPTSQSHRPIDQPRTVSANRESEFACGGGNTATASFGIHAVLEP